MKIPESEPAAEVCASLQGRQYWIVNEDQLRQLILDYGPDIRRDTERMGDMIRELVKLDREKAGLDKPAGALELFANKEKKRPSDPDFTGAGWIAGRDYRAAAWISHTAKLKISLLHRKQT
jgi:hypothetical protein